MNISNFIASIIIYFIIYCILVILLQILESRKYDEKLKCSVMSSKSLIHIAWSERLSFKCFYLLNANFVIVLEHTSLQMLTY